MTKLGKVTHSLNFSCDSLPEVEGTSLRNEILERCPNGVDGSRLKVGQEGASANIVEVTDICFRECREHFCVGLLRHIW